MEAELKRELAHHLHELTAQYERQGHSHEEAVRMAKREFGGSTLVSEQCRDERRGAWLAGLGQDVVFAIRQMRRSPGFAATAVLTLSLGIAANVIVFGVLQAMVLRTLDLPGGDRVMTLGLTKLAFPAVAYPEVRDVRDRSTMFSAVAAFNIQSFGLEANGLTRPVWGFEVGGQYFEAVAIRPFLGRLLNRADDDHPGASDAAVLSWPAWKTYFDADPDIVGRIVRINKQPYRIVGVTPENFQGTERFIQPSLFVPISNEAALEGEDWLNQRRMKHIFSIVRLKDGVTAKQAAAELETIAAGIRREYPAEEEGLAFRLARPGLMGDFLGTPARAFLAGVLGLAGIVLLAACANLGSLFAARTADRAREIAIRLAIGSSQWRILRQVLVEALMIALVGGACACGLAWIALTGLANWRPPTDYPMKFSVMPQPSLILIAFVVSTVAGVMFGAIPLRQIFKTDPNEVIKSGSGPLSVGRRWALRDCLLACQIALCCVTVTAGLVSLRGLAKAVSMDLGFEPGHAVVTRLELSQAGYTSESADRFERLLLERVLALPGVSAAGYTSRAPLDFPPTTAVFAQKTTDFRAANKAFTTYFFHVSPGYFEAADTALLSGRDVSFTDAPGKPLVAVVNREFARRLFPNEDAVGRYFRNRSGALTQIVGVVRDGKYLVLSEDPQPAVFYPISQNPEREISLVVRSHGDPAGMTTSVRRLVRDMDYSIPIRAAGPWKEQLGLSFFPSQVATVALGLFGAFGLLLSVSGTFGLASYTVSKRLRELSIRVELGARAKEILRAALGRMLILISVGSVVGIVMGAAGSRLLAAIVYQASAKDPLVLGAVVFTMAVTGALAVMGPVRRALQIDPAKLLREQ
jgi:predicted permease